MSDIRRACAGDYPELIGIWENAVRATHGFLSGEDFDAILSQMPQYLEKAELYVYEDGGLKGFVGLDGDNIDMLFVGDRGRGIGKALLGFAVNELGARKVDVNEQNHAARRFYENSGFRQFGRSETDSAGRPYPLLHMELK